MTDDEALETLFAMANVQDGYAKKATDVGLKLIHKANAKAQREVAAVIADLRANRDRWETDAKFWENRENEAVKRAETAEAQVGTLREALKMSSEGWRNALELDLLPRQHRHSAKTMADVAEAALASAQGGAADA